MQDDILLFERMPKVAYPTLLSMIKDLKEIETQRIYRELSVREIQINDRTRKKLIKLIGDKPMVSCRLGGKEVEVLWDTGSMVSLVDRRWIKKNVPETKIYSVSASYTG